MDDEDDDAQDDDDDDDEDDVDESDENDEDDSKRASSNEALDDSDALKDKAAKKFLEGLRKIGPFSKHILNYSYPPLLYQRGDDEDDEDEES